MSDIEPHASPAGGELTSQPDQADLEAACSGLALLNSPLPCVTSAMSHIHDLKKLVENWSQQAHSGKYQSELDQDGFQSKDSDFATATTDLYVEGKAISTKESCERSLLQKKVSGILSEAVHLIERLEADRQFTEETLQKEKTIRKTLKSKVDSLSVLKQTKLSTAVQKENEACSRGPKKLKRQLKRERKKAAQIQEKLSRAEELNKRLQEDSDFAAKQIPIVREKLEIHRGITHQIKAAQAKADEVFSETQKELLLAEKELKETEFDARQQKIVLDQELMEIKNNLSEKMDHLNQLEILGNDLVAQKRDAEETISLTERNCTNVTQRIAEVAELEKMLKDRSLQLELKIENEMHKNRKLISEQDEIKQKKTIWETKVSSIETQLRSKHQTLAAVCNDNLECEQKVENYKRKISESEEAVKQMRAEMKQMLQKITDKDEQWEKAREKMTQVVSQHSVTQAELEELEARTFMEEQRAREKIKNLTEELTSRKAELEAAKCLCAADRGELKKRQKSSEQTNQQLQKEYEESLSVTQALETKIKKLTEDVEKMQNEHKETLVSWKKEEKLKHDELKAAQDLHCATMRRYDSTLGRITDLMKESQEYTDASNKMENDVENMQDFIAELQKDLSGLEFKNQSAALIMSTLQSDINNCQQRTQRYMQTHTPHLQTRKKEMEDTKEALKKALIENKQLASDYEGLQKSLMEAKEESVSALIQRNQAEETYNYYTKLSLFQKRMHKALEKYSQQTLSSLAELDRCQALSQETSHKIKKLQEELSEEIQLISSFLDSLRDGSTTIDATGETEQACSGAAGLEV